MAARKAKRTGRPVKGYKPKKNVKQQHLSHAQEAFCKEYVLNGFNGTAAYRVAFPKTISSLDDTVAAMASKLLATAKIAQRVAVLKLTASAVAEKKFEITAERILQELAAVAFQRAGDYFEWGTVEKPRRRKNKDTGNYDLVRDENGNPIMDSVAFAHVKASEDLTDTQKAAIISVTENTNKFGDKVIETKMADKLGALKLLGQYKGLFKEKVEHTGKDGGPIQQQTSVTLPDIKNIKDPRDALKAFEAFRLGLIPGPAISASGKAN